jgi:hypothetical protein
MTCEHSHYKPIINIGKTFVVYKKLDISQSYIDYIEVIHVTKDSWAHDMTPITWCGGWSDGASFCREEAWKHFTSTHPYFLTELRNMRLDCVYIYGFNPFESFAAFYSCWPVYSRFIIWHQRCVWDQNSCFILNYF